MATAKKSAKKTARANAKTAKGKRGKGKKEPAVVLPNGFRVVGRAPNWDPEKHPVLEGERGPEREVTLNKGTKDEKETRCMTVVTEEHGALTVWESAGLRDIFDDTEDGDIIRIEFTGTLPAQKKGHSPMRLFSCAVKE